MGWLSGWKKQRIKITINHNLIDSDLSWHPITPFLTSTQAEEIFAELTTDGEYLKIAFTKADGVTQLFAEKEVFDVSELKAVFHISRENWAIASGADTDIYLYYDSTHADNTDYIGPIGARTEVWDGNFLAVYHSVDDNGNIDDSTSNSYDGTKKGAGEPAEATGKIGNAQLYDGTDDYITNPTLLDTMPAALTLESVSKITVKTGNAQDLMEKHSVNNEDRFYLVLFDNNTQRFEWEEHDQGGASLYFDDNWVLNTFQYLAITWDTVNGILLYKDGASNGANAAATTLMGNGTYKDFCLGIENKDKILPFKGIIDEVRVSSTQRVAAWLKGTHNSLWDSLLTYGSEEKSFEYVGTGTFAYSGTAIIIIGFTYAGSGDFVTSGSGICQYEKSEWEYAGSGTYSFSGVGLYSLGLFYVGIGEFVYSGSAAQIHACYYLYAGSGIFTYSGEAVLRWGDWTKIGKEASNFTEVDKGTSDWSKVEKGESDWKKTVKL